MSAIKDIVAQIIRGIAPSGTRYVTKSVDSHSESRRGFDLPEHMPEHVAIIMDGNRRWAVSRNLPKTAGHAVGTEALRDIIKACDEWGIAVLSIYAFSTENRSRSEEEVNVLMSLLLKYFSSEIDELYEKNVRILILGDVNGLPAPQRDAVNKAMERTKNNTGLKLNIAINYGGRAELVMACRSLAEKAAKGEIKPEEIDEKAIDDMLYTRGMPDVDLVIRTSGEKRLSNFLPWQTIYSELVFNKVYWPDYTRDVFLSDLREFSSRHRRFGKA